MSLTWTYDDVLSCDIATISDTLRVRAVRDDCPSNPFDDTDGHWPMLVRLPERDGGLVGKYECPEGSGIAISTPFNGSRLPGARITDHLLVHDQHAFARIMGYGTLPNPIQAMLDEHSDQHDITGQFKRCRDPEVLRNCLIAAYDDLDANDRMEALAAIYKLLSIPYWCGQVNGYSQGDWAELLIVAVPESQKLHWGEAVRSPDEIAADLQGQADLYRAWAFGDCYGYVLEIATPADDGDDEPDWEEIDSCWGYYGSDHAESGLEDAALESARILDKPEPMALAA
jgi:hypothetical protein